MFLLVLALVVLVGMAWAFAGVALSARRIHGVRRAGTAVRGEVVGTDVRKRGYYGGSLVRPEVSYTLGGHEYRAVVDNRSDAPEVGSSIDLIVDPARPSEPVAAYAGTSATALGASGLGVLIGIGLLLLAIHDMH